MELTYFKKLNVKNLAYDTMNLAQYDDRMTVCQTDQFVSVNSQLSSYNFNMITPIDTFDHIPKERLINEIKIFNKQRLPFNMWCYADDVNLIQFLKEQQLTEYDIAYKAMVLRLNQIEYIDVNELSLHVERITSNEQLVKFIHILCTIYVEKEEQAAIKQYYKQLSNVLLNVCHSTQLFIGYFQGEVVTTGALTFKNQTVGMYHIATHPRSRGQGFATDMIKYLLYITKQSKANYCTLQASPAAERIYESFGFKTVGHLQVFENKNIFKL